MAPRTKYEDAVYEKVEYSGKIFMYNDVKWDTLYPIVDIIRLLKPNTIIAHMYGKNQITVPMYGRQYNHLVLGYDLKKKQDYLENLKAVKNIFVFSDQSDTIATNLMNAAKKNKINVICYSSHDKIYHFYDYNLDGKFEFRDPEEVVAKMYYLAELEQTRKISDLFPDFEIIEPVVEVRASTLDQCSRFLKGQREINETAKKQREENFTKVFDPNLARLKHMERERNDRNMVYPDSVEILAKKDSDKRKTLLSKFFSK
jgi:hypothetical protein